MLRGRGMLTGSLVLRRCQPSAADDSTGTWPDVSPRNTERHCCVLAFPFPGPNAILVASQGVLTGRARTRACDGVAVGLGAQARFLGMWWDSLDMTIIFLPMWLSPLCSVRGLFCLLILCGDTLAAAWALLLLHAWVGGLQQGRAAQDAFHPKPWPVSTGLGQSSPVGPLPRGWLDCGLAPALVTATFVYSDSRGQHCARWMSNRARDVQRPGKQGLGSCHPMLPQDSSRGGAPQHGDGGSGSCPRWAPDPVAHLPRWALRGLEGRKQSFPCSVTL